jgi:hypothetical protein
LVSYLPLSIGIEGGFSYLNFFLFTFFWEIKSKSMVEKKGCIPISLSPPLKPSLLVGSFSSSFLRKSSAYGDIPSEDLGNLT